MNKFGIFWAGFYGAIAGAAIFVTGKDEGQKEGVKAGVDVGLTIGVAIGQELVNGNAETKTEVKESSE